MLPDCLLNLVKLKHPHIVTRLIHLLGERILGNLKAKPASDGLSGKGTLHLIH